MFLLGFIGTPGLEGFPFGPGWLFASGPFGPLFGVGGLRDGGSFGLEPVGPVGDVGLVGCQGLLGLGLVGWNVPGGLVDSLPDAGGLGFAVPGLLGVVASFPLDPGGFAGDGNPLGFPGDADPLGSLIGDGGLGLLEPEPGDHGLLGGCPLGALVDGCSLRGCSG